MWVLGLDISKFGLGQCVRVIYVAIMALKEGKMKKIKSFGVIFFPISGFVYRALI